MNNAIEGLMQDLLGSAPGPVPQSTQDQFHQVAQQAPTGALAQGIQAAFNSEQTPPFGAMVAHMFGQANPDQKAGIVNRLLAGLGPSAGTLLSRLGLPGTTPQSPFAVPSLTTDQATGLQPGQVEQIASQAQATNPGIVQTMSNFYAQHPVLVKTLGAVALSAILSNIRSGSR